MGFTSTPPALSIKGTVSTDRSSAVIASGSVPSGGSGPTPEVTLDPTWRSIYVVVGGVSGVQVSVIGLQTSVTYPVHSVVELADTNVFRVPVWLGVDTQVLIGISWPVASVPVYWAVGSDLDTTEATVAPWPGNPLTVAPVGGLELVQADVATNTVVTLLDAPPAGSAWRLQRWGAVGGLSTGTIELLLNSTPFGAFDLSGTPSYENLEGLSTTGPIEIDNATNGTVLALLAYDEIAVPSIR